MARIRSIHPGLFTDESFMSASIAARMLLIGIWTEAFDDGVFEWKPITLKARIFPVDNVALPELLSELETLDFVKRFEANGKSYGLLRNFCKWQRPKKPNSSGVLPEALHAYCCFTPASSEPVTNQPVTGGEKSPQMEDGGWREGEKNNISGGTTICAPAAAAALPSDELERRLEQATGWASLRNIAAIGKLVSEGFSLEDRILPLARSISEDVRARNGEKPVSWAFIEKAVRDPTREAKPCAKEVEMAFLPVGGPHWKALIAAGKRESFLKDRVKRAGDGTEGIFWAVRDLPTIQSQSAA